MYWLVAKKQPDLKQLRTEKRPRSEKYFDTTTYPKFKGTDKEYLALVKKHIKTKQMTTEEFAKQFGTLRKPLDPAKYPNVDITPEMVEEGDLFTSRSSKATQSAYETSNTKNRRAKSMEMQSITTDKAGEFEYHTFQDGEKVNADNLGKGRALHHKRGINQYRPFFEGLDQDQTIELANWFKQEGYPVGNHLDNLIALTENAKVGESLGLTSEPILHQGPGSIHNWQADVNVEPLNTHPLYKQLVSEMDGKSVAERIPFIMDYLEKVQDPIETKLGGVGSYEKIRDFQDSVGEIPSGPRAGQRLPVNRATVADSIIKDLTGPSKLGMRRRMIQGLGLTSAAALGTFGTAADAYETYERTKLAAETNDPIDKLQAGISATSTITGATGVGEIIGLPLEATNILIDQYRAGGAAPMAGRSGQKLIERRQANQRRQTIRPQPQTRRMGRGAAKRRQEQK